MNCDIPDPFSASKSEKAYDILEKFVGFKHEINKRRRPTKNKSGNRSKGNCDKPEKQNINDHCGFCVAAAAENSDDILYGHGLENDYNRIGNDKVIGKGFCFGGNFIEVDNRSADYDKHNCGNNAHYSGKKNNGLRFVENKGFVFASSYSVSDNDGSCVAHSGNDDPDALPDYVRNAVCGNKFGADMSDYHGKNGGSDAPYSFVYNNRGAGFDERIEGYQMNEITMSKEEATERIYEVYEGPTTCN